MLHKIVSYCLRCVSEALLVRRRRTKSAAQECLTFRYPKDASCELVVNSALIKAAAGSKMEGECDKRSKLPAALCLFGAFAAAALS